jgi:glycine betaine catabolism B
MKFQVPIKDIISRTTDCSSFRFTRPQGFEYKPGQYMLCTIKSRGKELMHAFSFSSSPSEQDYIEFTKKFTENEYSVAMREMKPGDLATIDAPYGKFTFEGEYPKIVLLTGGIGITPFRSIVKNCSDKKFPTSIILFYGCRSPSDIAFKSEFDQLQLQNPHFKAVYTVNVPSPDWKGLVGNITAELVQKEASDYKDRVFYACGPPGMVTAMTNLIKGLALPDSALKLESFAGY